MSMFPARKVTLGDLQSSGAVLRVARDAEGTFEMTRLIKIAEKGKTGGRR